MDSQRLLWTAFKCSGRKSKIYDRTKMSQEYNIFVLESGRDSFVPDTEQIINQENKCRMHSACKCWPGMFIFFMGEKNEE